MTAHKADALELLLAIRIHTPKPTMRAEIALASASSIGRPTGKTGSTSPLGQGQNVPAREASPKRRWIFTQNSPRNGGGLLRVVGVEGALFIRSSAHSLGKAFQAFPTLRFVFSPRAAISSDLDQARQACVARTHQP